MGEAVIIIGKCLTTKWDISLFKCIEVKLGSKRAEGAKKKRH